MELVINGEQTTLAEDEVTITRLLSIRKVESPEMVSVQVNGKILDREQYDRVRLVANDEVEFLYFMGGGIR